MVTFTIATMAETRARSETDAELVNDLKRCNAVLQAEIDMFEHYISRMGPKMDVSRMGPVSEITLQSRGRKTPERQLLTLEQKCDVAQGVHKQMSENLKILQSNSEKALDNYKAILEEADVHLAEVKKERCQFDHDITKTLRDKKTLIRVEKVIRYIEDRIKAKDNLIEKLHRQNAALLTHKRKLQFQLKQQEEMGKGKTALDFEQLKIENIIARKQLDDQNQKHLELKLLTSKNLQAFNSIKKKLHTTTQESDVLSSDISSRMKLLVKIEEETKQAEEERSKAEALNRKLRGQLADFQVPHVLQYIKVKDSHSQLEKSVKAWERKVEIAEMALKTYTQAWDRLRMSAGAGPTRT